MRAARAVVLARRRARRASTACASRARSQRSSTAARAAATCACPTAPAGPRLRAAGPRHGARRVASSSRPAQPVRYERAAGRRAGRSRRGRDGAAPRRARPPGSSYVAEGVDPDPAAARRCARCPPTIPPDVAGSDLRFAGEIVPPFGRAGREAEMAALFRLIAAIRRGARGRPRTRKARAVTRGAASPYQARGRARGLAAHVARLRRARRPARHARRARALGRRPGEAGYCQMFAASLAALARLSGVPARVAEGFAPGDRARRRLPRDRSRRARLGRGLVPRLRLAAVRRHARAARCPSARRPPRPRSTAARRRRAPTSGGPDGRAAAPAAAARPAARALGARARLGGSGDAWWDTRAALLLACCARRARRGCCSAKRALLRRLLPRDPARRGAPARARRSRPTRGSSSHPRSRRASSRAALERRFGVPADGFAAALERSAYAAPGHGRRRRPRGRDRRGCCDALRAVARTRRGGCAARSRRASLSAARDRAR